MKEVQRIDEAIAALEQLLPLRFTFVPIPDELVTLRTSVKTMMLRLLMETDRDWSVNEILEEYRNRGNPVQAKDPSNALRAAVAEANKAGTIFRTTVGRYKASKWRQEPVEDPADSATRRLSEAFPNGGA